MAAAYEHPGLGHVLRAVYGLDTAQRAIAEVPERANEQHYELPASFFDLVLGPRRKYSSCYWPDSIKTLEEAEESSLRITAERAGIQDGDRVLEMGCGWGALSLYLAERFPPT